MKTLLVLAGLLSLPAAHAAPTERLLGMARANPSCGSGYEIYNPADVRTCLIWSDLVPAQQQRLVEGSNSRASFYGEETDDGYVVASVVFIRCPPTNTPAC